ncbi:hypothetical protein [Butyrivibrio fibrisolvens]|uniref:hypothetical protein n=1 Tax=Butyrivibrio fibrisolvens TaxID=831 RepID=UPI000407C920|nr:hypothetical protein [Butyrivibrio fibrisolvens]
MKIIAMNCPECNAPLQINSELKKAFCNYCGSQILVDDEVQRISISDEDADKIGKAFFNAQTEREFNRTSLIMEQIKELKNAISSIEKIQSSNDDLISSINSNKAKLSRIKPWISFWNLLPNYYSAFILPVIIVFLTVYVELSSNTFNMRSILIGAILAGIAYVGQRYMINCHEDEYEQLNERIANDEDRMESNSLSIQKIRADHDFAIIPEKYQNSDALGFFYELFQGRRAVDLPQAIILYEDELHRRNIQLQQQQQIQLQREQIEQLKKQNQMKDNNTGSDVASTIGKAAVSVLALKIGHDIIKDITDDFLN